MCHLFKVGSRSAGAGRTPAEGKRKGTRRGKAGGADRDRLARLEELLDVVLRASLRGRLLPAERRMIKKHLDARKDERKQEQATSTPARCPACRSVLPDPKPARCPWCSVLLNAGRKTGKKR